MNNDKFNFWNRICALFAFVVSAVTYLLTIEPSASYWDCGEFIASSYKLEVGHPPGNPVFQLIARFFTLFGDNMHAAVLINAMSAICSALTIFLLYLTIVWFAKRLIRSVQGEYSLGEAVAIFGSGLVGSLAYCFSDTFWFSAVEGEVYAMSSLFTALVFWAMTKWYDQADEPHSGRWIVLIAFLMGLSIGIHLLNLLAIPALVFMFYYRRHENEKFGFWGLTKIFLVGVAILAVILFVIIPLMPKMAAYFDLFFVNSFGLPYNVGASFFLVLVLALCFWGMFVTLRKGRVFWNTALLCLTSIIIGFSIFSIDIIRSCAKTPTNEYQPDNAFTLVRYLSREQYGSTPLVYGQYFDADYTMKKTKYWAPLNGKYKKVNGPDDAQYKEKDKMLFPRMWSPSPDGRYEEFYSVYTKDFGRDETDESGNVIGRKYRKPSMGANLAYFFDYQLNWMYWRYFMWNFVGRQNEIHSPVPGEIFFGNWESGVKFIDDARLGDQSLAPECLRNNKGKNHYFFLPLLLGLLGLFFQFDRDRRGCWLTFLMFFMTGIAIVLYLNQPPYQVRERDYAYAGSFYFFSVWIGLAVAAIYKWISAVADSRYGTAVAVAASVACLGVPALMGAQNWDDHDRSNRATAVEMAKNYLESVGPNGYLVTHGDNDTFPVWYAQEVENVRPDVRVINTSLLGTDWHIDQMKWACNESAPIPLSVSPVQYLYGTNEYVLIYALKDTVMSISEVMEIFRDPREKLMLERRGTPFDYIASRKISIPVNKENVIANGILDACYAERIPDEIVLTIPSGKRYLSKPEIFMLDLLSNYEWDRPLHLLNMGGDLNIGLKEYLEYQGYSYKFVPIKNKTSASYVDFVNTDELYRKMTQVYKWDSLARDDYFIDYQNLYTHLGVMSVRGLFVSSAKVFLRKGEDDRALEMLDKCQEVMAHYPIETLPIDLQSNDYYVSEMVDCYYKLGEKEKGAELAARMKDALFESLNFFVGFPGLAEDKVDNCMSNLIRLAYFCGDGGDLDMFKEINGRLMEMVCRFYESGNVETARLIAGGLYEGLMGTLQIMVKQGDYPKEELESCLEQVIRLADNCKQGGDKEMSDAIMSSLKDMKVLED